MEQLRDIKGLVEVTDYSLYYLLGLIGLAVVVLGMLSFFLYKFLTKKEKITQQKLAREKFKDFTFDGSKESLYQFTHLAQYAVSDSKKEALEAILIALEAYKYKKEMPELDDALKMKIEQFIKEVHRG